jgi:hypothetical protein
MVTIVNNSISFEFQAKMGIGASLFTGFFLIVFLKKIMSLKNAPHIRIPAGFPGPVGLNYVVKNASI